MKLSGIDYFMTTKLSWSEYNLTPYDTFMWKGIDGTKVLTHFSPSREYFEAGHGEGHEGLSHYTTYNALIQPSQIAGGWKRFQQKGIDDHFLVSYGYGDGGGGPTRLRCWSRAGAWKTAHAQHARGAADAGAPLLRGAGAARGGRPAAARVERRTVPRVPSRHLHRSWLDNKRNNRKIELALRSAELRFLEAAKYGMAYPAEALASHLEGWC